MGNITLKVMSQPSGPNGELLISTSKRTEPRLKTVPNCNVENGSRASCCAGILSPLNRNGIRFIVSLGHMQSFHSMMFYVHIFLVVVVLLAVVVFVVIIIIIIIINGMR